MHIGIHNARENLTTVVMAMRWRCITLHWHWRNHLMNSVRIRMIQDPHGHKTLQAATFGGSSFGQTLFPMSAEPNRRMSNCIFLVQMISFGEAIWKTYTVQVVCVCVRVSEYRLNGPKFILICYVICIFARQKIRIYSVYYIRIWNVLVARTTCSYECECTN